MNQDTKAVALSLDQLQVRRRRTARQVAFASFVGTTTEWYDFFLYGTAAALVFPKLFFPGLGPFTGTLASFASFGVAFFARPMEAPFSAISGIA